MKFKPPYLKSCLLVLVFSLSLFLNNLEASPKYVGIYFQNHLHSQDDHTFSRFPNDGVLAYGSSYSAEGLSYLIQQAKRSSIDSIAITDHNTISHWFDPVYTQEKNVILIPAEEWTNMFGGHATLLDFNAADETQAIVPAHPHTTVEINDYKKMMDFVHNRGGIVIINHPKSSYVFHRWPDDTFSADGIEFNFSDFMLPKQVISWWTQNLRAGKKLFLLGGSDYHVGSFWGGDPFQSTNFVFVESRENLTKDSVMEALRHGRSEVLRSIHSPKVQMSAIRLDGDATELGITTSTFQISEELTLHPLQSLFLHIEVIGGQGGYLWLYSQNGLIKRGKKIETNDFSVDESYMPMQTTDFIRAEVTIDGQLETVVNPIYIRKNL